MQATGAGDGGDVVADDVGVPQQLGHPGNAHVAQQLVVDRPQDVSHPHQPLELLVRGRTFDY